LALNTASPPEMDAGARMNAIKSWPCNSRVGWFALIFSSSRTAAR
jgi:hypothetical protein